MELLMELAERLSVIATIALLMTKSQVFRRYLSSQITQREKLTLILIFGILSMAGTYSGVSINGALANTSAIGTVSAGLLGGPMVGLGVGAITGLHFYIFYGGFTGLACAVSPIMQGLLGGLVYWLAREKACDWKVGIGLGVIAQIMEMVIILMLARPFVEAWNLVMIIATPMLVSNGIGVGIFLYIYKTVYIEEEQIAAIQAQKVLQIADKTLPYFRKGLNLESAQKAAEIIQRMSNVAGVALTDTEQIIAFVGLGADHHFSGQPILTEATHKVLQTGKPFQAISEKEIDCLYPNCPLRSAIVVPLCPGEKTIGVLILYRDQRGKSVMDVTLAEGLGKLFSTQLELADLEHQKELNVAAEIRALQAQIQPHFLFNTLNTIVSLIRMQPEKAREVLIFLGEFLRHNMRQGVVFHSVREECEHVQAYLAIEEARFRDKLKVNLDIGAGTAGVLLPPLILQPLVENAVRHGLLPKENGGTVTIHTHIEGDNLDVVVQDDGIGISNFKLRDIIEGDQDERDEIGIGLKNVHRRLLRLYGQGLLIESTLGEGTIISFRVPTSGSVLRGVT
ncbi:sensor histidine kinase [Desulfosporosinus burensis]